MAKLVGAWSASWSGHKQKVVPGANYSETALASSWGCSWRGLKLLIVFGAKPNGPGAEAEAGVSCRDSRI